MEGCPVCSRAFERLEDFPLAYITKFERSEIPELIGSLLKRFHPERKSKMVGNQPLPKNVLRLFQESGKYTLSYEGRVYRKTDHHHGTQWYESADDVTSTVKKAIAKPEIQASLSALEKFVGKEIPTKDILDLPGFNKVISAGRYNDLSLCVSEIKQIENGLRECSVILTGGWTIGSIRVASINQELVQLGYEGRIIR